MKGDIKMCEKNLDLIDKIYIMQEEELDKIIRIKTQEIEKEFNYDEIEELLKENKDSKKILSKIEEKYNKKTGILIEEFYKKGFKDGVNLIINCFKNN